MMKKLYKYSLLITIISFLLVICCVPILNGCNNDNTSQVGGKDSTPTSESSQTSEGPLDSSESEEEEKKEDEASSGLIGGVGGAYPDDDNVIK